MSSSQVNVYYEEIDPVTSDKNCLCFNCAVQKAAKKYSVGPISMKSTGEPHIFKNCDNCGRLIGDNVLSREPRPS